MPRLPTDNRTRISIYPIRKLTILTKSEHIIILINPLRAMPKLSLILSIAILHQVFLHVKTLIVHTVQPGVHPGMNLVFALKQIPEIYHCGFMLAGRCSNEF